MELVKNFSDETGKGGNPGGLHYTWRRLKGIGRIVGNSNLQGVFERILRPGSKTEVSLPVQAALL